jgi:serine/threonine-protein kinase
VDLRIFWAAVSETIEPGAVLADRYRVERVLGRGGMGAVVAVRNVAGGELRAMKIMHESMRKSADAAVRFVREARAAQSLTSDHVVRVYEVGQLESGLPFAVMEYLEGRDLADELEARGALPIAEVVDLILQTLEPLAEAHALGIVHRDLKPANLFLTRGPHERPFVKILDFGISKLTGQASAGAMQLTRTRTMLGSPQFMAPEQMRSARSVDARADIWSLGVVAYCLLTAQLPFSGKSLTDVLMSVARDEPRSPRDLRPDIPEPLAAVTMRCLRKDPAERFQNVAELASALAPFGAAGARDAATRIAETVVAPRTRTRQWQSGRYLSEQLLGQWRGGEAHVATDHACQRRVVVRTSSADCPASLRERFSRAAELMSRVAHPHIASCHDRFEESNEIAAVIEHIEGDSLRQLLQSAVAPQRALPWFVAIAEALGVMHQHGLVHGDLTPDAIVIHATRGAVLIDAGLTPPSELSASAPAAAYSYAPPERLGNQRLEPGSDVYSLALALLHALRAELPMPARDLKHALVLRTLPPDAFFGPKVPKYLHRILRRSLALEASERCNLAQLIAALRSPPA